MHCSHYQGGKLLFFGMGFSYIYRGNPALLNAAKTLYCFASMFASSCLPKNQYFLLEEHLE